MKDLNWEDMPLVERMEVWKVYTDYIKRHEGWDISFEQCNIGWSGSRWITIKYAFGIAENLR